jgi:hypothetical protein
MLGLYDAKPGRPPEKELRQIFDAAMREFGLITYIWPPPYKQFLKKFEAKAKAKGLEKTTISDTTFRKWHGLYCSNKLITSGK